MGFYHTNNMTEKKGASRAMEILGTIGFGLAGTMAAGALTGAGGNGGLLSGVFSAGGNADQKISALESGLVYEAAKNYADKNDKEVYAALYAAQQIAAEKAAVTAAELAKLQCKIEADARLNEAKDEKAKLETELAVQRATAPLILRLQKCEDSIPLVQERCLSAVAAEASARKCADNAIVNYANTTFYAKLVAGVTPTSDTTPQDTYNPLPCQTPCQTPCQLA